MTERIKSKNEDFFSFESKSINFSKTHNSSFFYETNRKEVVGIADDFPYLFQLRCP